MSARRLPSWVTRRARPSAHVDGCGCGTRRTHEDAREIAIVAGYRVSGDDYGAWYSAPTGGAPNLDTTLAAVGPYPIVYDEKFIDPWWNCIRGAETPGEWEKLDYLMRVPATGKDRVAAMRKQIDAFADPPGAAVLAMQKQSWDTADAIREQLSNDLATADGRKNLAAKVGVPVDVIEANAESLLETLKTYGLELEPLFKSLFKEFGQPILDGIKNAIESATGIALGGAAAAEAAADTAIGFAGAIPLVGTFASMFISMYSDELMRLDADKIHGCETWAQSISISYKKSASYGLPSPWHRELFGTEDQLKCTSDANQSRDATPHLASLGNVANAWLVEFNDLPTVPYKGAVAKWWLTALTYMSDPAVLAAFNALGRDKWGAGLATDEQVMLVAIPIAISYGFADIDGFAAELWDRSKGWSDLGTAVVDAHHDRAGQPYLYMAEVRRNKLDCPGFLSAGGCVETAEYQTMCTANVKNAYFAQFAVLARDAIALAEEKKAGMKAGTPLSGFLVTLALPAKSSIQDRKTSIVPLVIGGVGSGIAALARASIPVIALPASLGIGVYAWARHVKAADAPPLPPVDRPKFYGFTTSNVARTTIGDKISSLF